MANKSDFQFDDFGINRSSFKLDEEVDISDLTISLNPSGKVDYKNGRFELTLNVKINDPKEVFIVEVDATGFFSFENGAKKENLKGFLFHNAPALLFPYIRAYISSLTTLSGIQPITLPTLNLSNLVGQLDKNLVEVMLD